MKARKPIPRLGKKRLAALGDGPRPRSTVSPSRKPIRKRNPERQAKLKASYAKGMAAYRKSETAKVVKARAGGRCEAALKLDVDHGLPWTIAHIKALPILRPWFCREIPFVIQRCENSERLQDHHLSYARFGGDELLEDMLRCCKRCHDFLEALKPTTRQRRA